MIRVPSMFGRAPMRLGMIAGLCSLMALFMAQPSRAANSAQEQVSRDFQQTVTLGAGQSVRVEHKFGSINLHGGPGHDV